MKTTVNQLDDPQTQLRELLDELQSFEHVDGVLKHIHDARLLLLRGRIGEAFVVLLDGWNQVSMAVNGYHAATAAANDNLARS